MSRPRPVYPGSTYMIVRRTAHRQFLLKPSKKHNNAWEYCLAVAAKKAGVWLLWSKTMSNHHHTGVYDPHGNISIFCRELHRLIAKHHNASFGRFENFWSSDKTVMVRLEDADAVLDKLTYSLANAVKADLVATAKQWPGVVSLPKDLCSTKTVTRPKTFFRKEGSMPATIELEYRKPPEFDHLSADEFRRVVAERLRAEEEKAAERREKDKRSVVGRGVIRKQSHKDSPTTWAKRFGIKPRVATKDKWRRIEALQRLKAFVQEYRDALLRWRAGERDVCFPYGTNLMRVMHGVRCRPAPG